MRDCPLRGGAEGMAQTSGAAGASSAASVAMRPTGRGTPPAAGRGRDHGGASGSSGPVNRIYALPGQQGQEVPDNVIPGILYVCLRAMNVLVDLLMLSVMCENERLLGCITFEDECS